MRVLHHLFRVVSLSLVAVGVALAQAPTSKSPDVQTVGGITSVLTTLPADLTSATGFVPPAPRPATNPAAQPPKTIAVGPLAPPPLAKEPSVLPHAPNLADVFGRIPRLEWGTGAIVKPAEVVTVGETSVFPSPAPAAKPAVVSAPAAGKPAEKTTSLPRDPNAPAPAPGKVGGKEVPQ